MKNMVECLFVTIGMFTKIPTPQIEWNKKNMRYVFVFFPFIGIIIGVLEYLWFLIYQNNSIDKLLYSIVAAILPVIITGGIHVDGFVDSCDAFFSYGNKEKKIEILSDPNVGAFGVIYLIIYFLIVLGCFSQISETEIIWFTFTIPFVMSRTVGGLMMKLEKSAKSSGLMVVFKNSDEKDKTILFLFVWLVLVLLSAGYLSYRYMIFCIIGIVLFVVIFRRYAYRNIGGFTGDLIGFSVTVTEVICLVAIATGGIFDWF